MYVLESQGGYGRGGYGGGYDSRDGYNSFGQVCIELHLTGIRSQSPPQGHPDLVDITANSRRTPQARSVLCPPCKVPRQSWVPVFRDRRSLTLPPRTSLMTAFRDMVVETAGAADTDRVAATGEVGGAAMAVRYVRIKRMVTLAMGPCWCSRRATRGAHIFRLRWSRTFERCLYSLSVTLSCPSVIPNAMLLREDTAVEAATIVATEVDTAKGGRATVAVVEPLRCVVPSLCNPFPSYGLGQVSSQDNFLTSSVSVQTGLRIRRSARLRIWLHGTAKQLRLR